MKFTVCIPATKGNSDLFKFLRYLQPFLKYKYFRKITKNFFYSVGPKIPKNTQKYFVPTLKCCRKVSFDRNLDMFLHQKAGYKSFSLTFISIKSEHY